MKRSTRIHIAVNVTSLETSKKFYTLFFGTLPTRDTGDQIDWILNSPPIHFSIYSSPNYEYGVEHIGMDFTQDELAILKERIKPDGINLYDPDKLKIEVYSSNEL